MHRISGGTIKPNGLGEIPPIELEDVEMSNTCVWNIDSFPLVELKILKCQCRVFFFENLVVLLIELGIR